MAKYLIHGKACSIVNHNLNFSISIKSDDIPVEKELTEQQLAYLKLHHGGVLKIVKCCNEVCKPQACDKAECKTNSGNVVKSKKEDSKTAVSKTELIEKEESLSDDSKEDEQKAIKGATQDKIDELKK